MDVSVVLSTYNRARQLPTAVRALFAQRVPAGLQWELVLVDNNSSDETREVAGDLAADAPMPLRYVFEPRQGLSFGRNTGIEHAKGQIIAFTDDDVLPDPTWIARVAAAMTEHAADVVGGRILPRWERPAPAWLLRSARLRSNLALVEHDAAATLHPAEDRVVQIYGANMAFRSEVFSRIGTFDTRQGRIGGKLYSGEETTLIERVLVAGMRAVFDPRLVVWHHIPPERVRRSYFFRMHLHKGELEARLAPPAGGRRLLGVPLHRYRHLVRTVGACLAAALRGRGDVMERAVDAVEAAGRIRGSIQARRLAAKAGR